MFIQYIQGTFPAKICWSWRRLQNVLSVIIFRLPRRLEDVLKTSWRRLEDIWPRRLRWSWSRRLQDVLKMSWRHMAKMIMLVLLKMSWRRLEDVFWRWRWKTSSRRLHQDECLLGLFKEQFWWSGSLFYKLMTVIDNFIKN